MTTAQQIVEDAAALILVDEANTGLEASEALIMLRFLNDYMAALYDDGVDVGYRSVSALSDPVTMPQSANLAVKYILASISNPIFGLPIPQEVAFQARDMEKSLRSRFFKIGPMQYPQTLPLGSGNQNRTYGVVSPFYPVGKPEGQIRLSASTTVDIVTQNTAVQLGGTWTVDRNANLTVSGAVLTYQSETPYLAKITFSFTTSTTTGDRYRVYIARNDALTTQGSFPFVADSIQNNFVEWVDTINKGDEISVYFESENGTNDLVVTNGQLCLS